MNSNELAALLSVYRPNSDLIRPTPESQTMLSEQSRSWSPAKLTTCDKIQTTRHGRQHRRNPSISLNYNPYDDHHTSSRRAQHNLPKPSDTITQTSINSLPQVTEEPDFVIEEREAWSRSSPNATLRGPATRRSNKVAEFILYDELLTNSTDDEDHGHIEQHLPAFAPASKSTGVNGRPKTSRGPEFDNSVEQQNTTFTKAYPRFIEGSMSSRSGAVSSSWSQYSSDYEASEYETDASDITPKASHGRRSSSIDLQDFQPPPVSASTIKRTLFRRRKNDKTDDESRKPEKTKTSKMAKDDRKKPRKSISNWNLHAIGEKIGLFNSSSTSIDDARKVVTPVQSPNRIDVLDDRKRKAEEAYAMQFGSKKQRHDTDNLYAYMSEPDQPVRTRSQTAAVDVNATIRARRAPNLQHPTSGATMPRRVSSNDLDARKQQTMKELQKENQLLRDLLQEQQASRNGNATRKSRSIKSNTTADQLTGNLVSSVTSKDAPPIPALSTERKLLGDIANSRNRTPHLVTKNENSSVMLTANHPILKPTPPSRSSQLSSSARRKSLPALPRPVSMIIEEPEGDDEKVPGSKGQESQPKAKFVIKNATKKGVRRKMEIGKENEVVIDQMAVPTLDSEKKGEWDGWDEDVF